MAQTLHEPPVAAGQERQQTLNRGKLLLSQLVLKLKALVHEGEVVVVGIASDAIEGVTVQTADGESPAQLTDNIVTWRAPVSDPSAEPTGGTVALKDGSSLSVDSEMAVSNDANRLAGQQEGRLLRQRMAHPRVSPGSAPIPTGAKSSS